jgi:hypothetical protein
MIATARDTGTKQNAPLRWQRLIAVAAIVVLSATLASRTVDVKFHRQTTVTSQAQKAKIQHRDKDGACWAPPVATSEPFYLAVSACPVEGTDDPPLPVRVDDVRYNRPPPRS